MIVVESHQTAATISNVWAPHSAGFALKHGFRNLSRAIHSSRPHLKIAAMSFLWILLIGTAAIAATLMLVQGWERRRARLLKEVGTALGFRAVEKNEPLAVPSVEIMRKRGRIIGAALEGTWKGERVLVFDLSYPAGKSISQTTVFMLRLSEPRLPEFAAIPKNIWLYTPTVDLPRVETRPGPLKSHWLLYAPEGQWPFGLEIAEWLEESRKWSFEGRGSGLFLYRRSKRAPTKTLHTWLDEALAEALKFARRVPARRFDSFVDEGEEETYAHTRTFRFKVSFRI